MRSRDALGAIRKLFISPSQRCRILIQEIYIGSEIVRPLMYRLTNADNNSDILIQLRSFVLKKL
jgi:hypothetical protein